MQPNETLAAPQPVRPDFLRDTRDRVMTALALALGVLFCELVLFPGKPGVGLTVWLALLYGASLWYLRGAAPRSPLSWALLVPIAALGACFTLYDNMILKFFNFVLLVGLTALQLAQWSGMRFQPFTALGLIADLFHSLVILPLAHIPSPFRVLAGGSAQGQRRRGWVQVLLGVLVALPLLAIVLALLSSADAVFDRLLGDTMRFIRDNMAETLAKVIVGAILAVLLGGFLYALRRRKPVGGFDRPLPQGGAAVLDSRLTVTVLALLCAVYAAFIAVQFGYLFGGFGSLLPQAFTYAEYARRGFFELMGVVAVNLGVYCLALALTRRPLAAACRAMLLTLGVCTLALIASALAKMFMYIGAYGLTEMRIYTSWFMALCALVFIALMLHVILKRFPAMPVIFTVFLVMYLGLNFANVDANMARFNLIRYQSGVASTVDLHMTDGLSDSVVPVLVPLLQEPNAFVAQTARRILESRASMLGNTSWQTFNIARAQAQAALAQAGIPLGDPSER